MNVRGNKLVIHRQTLLKANRGAILFFLKLFSTILSKLFPVLRILEFDVSLISKFEILLFYNLFCIKLYGNKVSNAI